MTALPTEEYQQIIEFSIKCTSFSSACARQLQNYENYKTQAEAQIETLTQEAVLLEKEKKKFNPWVVIPLSLLVGFIGGTALSK